MSELERILKEAFPLRSQLNRELKPRTAKLIRVNGDLVDDMEKSGRVKQFVELIKGQLPKDAYLLDDIVNGGVCFPLPSFTNTGMGTFMDAYGIILGSDEWPTNQEGECFKHLNAIFRKDPTTWAITCELKDVELSVN